MDDLGNRLRGHGTVNFAVDDDTNRYTSVGSNTVSHDNAGNTTVDENGYQYFYDYENRIIRIKDSDDHDIAYFEYDALGRRFFKYDYKSNDTKYFYYNDKWQVLAEYDGSGNIQRRFFYGNYIDEVLHMDDGTGSTRYYYAHNHLFSPVALIDNTGSIVERYEYNAYGKMTRLDPDFTAWSGTEAGNPYYFTGRRLDTIDSGSLEIMYYRNRYYSTYTGRFLTQDILMYIDGMNSYEYVGSSPLLQLDPWGLSEQDISEDPRVLHLGRFDPHAISGFTLQSDFYLLPISDQHLANQMKGTYTQDDWQEATSVTGSLMVRKVIYKKPSNCKCYETHYYKDVTATPLYKNRLVANIRVDTKVVTPNENITNALSAASLILGTASLVTPPPYNLALGVIAVATDWTEVAIDNNPVLKYKVTHSFNYYIKYDLRIDSIGSRYPVYPQPPIEVDCPEGIVTGHIVEVWSETEDETRARIMQWFNTEYGNGWHERE